MPTPPRQTLLPLGHTRHVETQTQDEGSNKYSRANGIYPVLDSYKEGQVIEMKVAMSVYHWVRLMYDLVGSVD